MSHSEEIAAIVDKHLAKLVNAKINNIVGSVEPEMVAPSNYPQSEWQSWLPVNSTVTSDEILEIEGRFGIKFPADYIAFLSHKHFYDLCISEAEFCWHPIRTWRKYLTDMSFSGYPREYLIDRGWMPFANWSDWGHLCFDTTVSAENFPVGLWDHEQADILTPKHSDFYEMLVWLDKQSDLNG